MSKRPSPQITRAGRAETVASASGAPPGPTTDGHSWSSGAQGGNVLQWLAQQTQGPTTEPSRGAIEYLAGTTSKPPRAVRDAAAEPVAPEPQPVAKVEEAASGTTGAPSGVRGRRRKEGPTPQHLARQQEEAMKQHEEALRTDPEYQRQFQTYRERQQVMQTSQVQFFEHYRKQQNVRLEQVVAERLDMPVILDLIDQHDVVFICTDTGSGKSTNVPKALLELSPDTRVVSTQPRRTATAAIATRVAGLRRENVGEDVGYWIRGEKKGDAQTRLWYMTSYTLLLRLLENPAELPFTHIVLDEFHERQPDVEVVVALLRLALRHRTRSFKLILMSATLNTADWEAYFAGLRVATYKQSEPEHPIHDYFLEDACTLVGLDYQAPPHLRQRAVVEKDTMDRHLYIAQNLLLFLNGVALPHHSVLVFLPGRAQVESMQMWAESHLAQRVDVVPWHSAVDLSTIEAAMKRHHPRRQKVYLATDIAEVSITLPDVVFVIDLVLVKRPQMTVTVPASILYPPLVTQWASRGSLAQRRGRVGRVQQGFYFCLFPADQVTELTEHAQPPIENARIDELSLHCLQIVSNPVAIFTLCHGQPLVETISSAMNTLTQLGCILDAADPGAAGERIPSIHGDHGAWGERIVSSAQTAVQTAIAAYTCTFVGRMLQLIPVSPQPGMLVFFGALTGLESLMILAAATTSSLSPFTLHSPEGPMRRRFNVARAMEETENVMRELCCGLRSDIVAVMKAVLLFRVESQRSGATAASIRQWCTQKHLSHDKLLAIVDLENHIKYELAEFMPFRDIGDPAKLLEQLDKLAAMVAVMTNVAFASQSVEVTSEGNTYTNSKEMALGLFSELSAVPDIHSPSCLRWQEGDIIIPVQLSLLFDKLLASFSTAIASPRQFWMSLLLFSHRTHYATFSDEAGTFHVFSLVYCGKGRYVEVDEIAGYAVLDFRRRLSAICATLRLLQASKNLPESERQALVEDHGLKPLQDAQREVITALVSIFGNLDGMTVDEVEHDEDDLDLVSMLSFALPPPRTPCT